MHGALVWALFGSDTTRRRRLCCKAGVSGAALAVQRAFSCSLLPLSKSNNGRKLVRNATLPIAAPAVNADVEHQS